MTQFALTWVKYLAQLKSLKNGHESGTSFYGWDSEINNNRIGEIKRGQMDQS
jgi:hypothetical protein